MKQYYLAIILLLSFNLANAQWSADTMIRNPICVATGTQYQQQLCTDGTNGAYIIWSDLRSKENIYAQHIDSAGYIQWAVDGIPVNDTSMGGSSSPSIAPDTKNGAFIAWEHDIIGGYGHLAIDHINKSGTSVWGGNKDITPANDNRAPILTPDGHGGLIVNWYSYVSYGGDQILLQWLDSTGRTRLTTGGLIMSSGSSAHYSSELITDNNFNAYLVFANYDTLMVLKVDSGGNLPWGSHGKILTTTFDNYSTHYGTSTDGKGGVIVSWGDTRNNPLRDDLYTQRITSGGNFLWGSNALLVDSLTTLSNTYIAVSPDENGGEFICMGYGHLFMDHVSSNGTVSWNAPKPVTTSNYGQNYPSMDVDGFHGVIVAWDDGRDGTSVYAQRIDTSGNYLWEASGAPVHTGYIAGAATGTRIISLGNGYAIAAMNVSSDIYAAKFTGLNPISTGITAINNTAAWNVYPNPATNNVYLQNNSADFSQGQIEVYNTVGQLIQVQELELTPFGKQIIGMPENAHGIYYLKVMGGSKMETYKLVLE